MNGLISVLIYTALLVLFITFLPSLIWMFLIFVLVSFVWNLIRCIFFKDSMKKHVYTRTYRFDDQNIDEQPNYSSYQTHGRIDPDVIDVEYTQKEE